MIDRSKFLLIVVAVVAPALVASHVLAVPAFSRRYATSCATCHQAFPRLNGVGESFRIMGYRFVDDERYRKQDPVELGDENYRRLWPKAIWPSDIPHAPPLSFMTRFMAEFDLDGSRPTSTTFLLPEEIELVWAGNFADKFLFYGDIIYLQKDFGGQKPDSWATLKAWLQIQDLGVEKKLNLRLGTVGTQTMGLFTARDANFYGTHFYLYSQWVLPPVNLKEAGLTEFKGNNFTITPQAGLELNGYGKNWFYALGVANGNVEVASTGRPESDISFFGMGQGSKDKDLYLHLAYKFGGIPFDRSAESPKDTIETGVESWRDDNWTMSFYGYSGTAEIRTVDETGLTLREDDDFYRVGVGLLRQYKDIVVSGLYMRGRDDNPYGSLSDQAVDSRNWHVEILGFAFPWMMPYARYEVLELDMPTDVPGLNREQDISRVLAGAKFLLRPNVAVVTEAAYYTEGAELEEGFDQTLFALLAIAF